MWNNKSNVVVGPRREVEMKESRSAVSDKVRCWTLNTFNTRGHVVCLFLYSTDSPAQSIFSTGNKAAPEIIKVSQQACLFYYYIYCSCKNCYSIAHFVVSFFYFSWRSFLFRVAPLLLFCFFLSLPVCGLLVSSYLWPADRAERPKLKTFGSVCLHW